MNLCRAYSDRWQGERLAIPTRIDEEHGVSSGHVFLDPKRDSAFITAGQGSPICYIPNAAYLHTLPNQHAGQNYVIFTPVETTQPKQVPLDETPEPDETDGTDETDADGLIKPRVMVEPDDEDVEDPLSTTFNPPLDPDAQG